MAGSCWHESQSSVPQSRTSRGQHALPNHQFSVLDQQFLSAFYGLCWRLAADVAADTFRQPAAVSVTVSSGDIKQVVQTFACWFESTGTLD
jgi:hypothetical protein